MLATACLVGAALVWLGAAAAALICLAAVFAPVVVARPVIAVCIAIALLPVDVLLVAEVGQTTVKPSHLLFGAVLAALALGRSRSELLGRIPREARPVLLGVAVLGLTQIASLTTGWPGMEVALSRIAVMVGGGLVPLLAITLAVDTRDKFRSVVAVFVTSQVAFALIGLYQLAALEIGLPFPTRSGTVAGAARIESFSLEPGYYAVYIASAIPLLLFLLFRGERIRGAGASLAFVVLVPTLVLVNSRAGYVLAAVAVIAGCLMLLFQGGRSSRSAVLRLGTTVVAAIIALVAISASVGVAVQGVVGRQVENLTRSDDECLKRADNNACTSNRLRLELYEAGWQIFEDNAVLGIGDGRSVEVLPSYGITAFAPGNEATLQNVVIEVAAESGVVGLAGLAFLLIQLALLTFWRFRRASSPEAWMARMLLLGGFILLTVGGLVIMWLWDTRVWALVGIGIAGLHVSRDAVLP